MIKNNALERMRKERPKGPKPKDEKPFKSNVTFDEKVITVKRVDGTEVAEFRCTYYIYCIMYNEFCFYIGPSDVPIVFKDLVEYAITDGKIEIII